MSRNFIGSKIAIVTKSQCRYVGTIIGIDAQTSSIILGNVKCFGTENRPGNLTNGEKVGTITPIMQFANSDIEDLKIVDEDQTSETSQQQSRSMPVISSPPSSQQPSIHDDPAIVSAVMSSSNKDNKPISSISSQLMHNLHHLTLSDEQSKTLPKNEESRIRLNSGELGPSWSLLSPSKWENNNNNSKPSSQQHPGNKSKFFDDFTSNKNNNNTDQFQSNRYHQRPSNTHSTQTLRENGGHYNDQEDDSALPVRQPFFSNDQPYPQQQQQQQLQEPNRHQNGNMQHQQRYFYNNRRPPMQNQQQQRRTGGGNRETFQYNANSYDNDFDFETSNRKFNKIASEDEFKQQTDLPISQSLHAQLDIDSTTEYAPLYDKKKSFFDNVAVTESSDASITSMFNRSKNKDTFGNDGYQRQQNRPINSGYRRSNNNNYQQRQYGNDDFYYRQQNNNNNNGYHYRY